MTTAQILALIQGIIDAIEAGHIAAESVKGMTLDELQAASAAGWDKFDKTIEAGKKAGHED